MTTDNTSPEFGVLFISDGTGRLTTDDPRITVHWTGQRPEEAYELVEDDSTTDREAIEMQLPGGWEALPDHSNQYGYSGPVLHPSEVFGAGLEDHVRAHPGAYVLTVIDTDCAGTGGEFCDIGIQCDCEPRGWAVLHYELTASEARAYFPDSDSEQTPRSPRLETIHVTFKFDDGSEQYGMIMGDGGWTQWGGTREQLGRTVDPIHDMAREVMDYLPSDHDDSDD